MREREKKKKSLDFPAYIKKMPKNLIYWKLLEGIS